MITNKGNTDVRKNVVNANIHKTRNSLTTPRSFCFVIIQGKPWLTA